MSRMIDAAKFIFVVGTPGAGKSLICHELEKILKGNDFKCSRHGDYPFLQLLYKTDMDSDCHDRFKSDPKSEFVVLDQSVYDKALELVYDNILKNARGSRTIKIIEFSRPRYDTAFLYYTLEALGQSVIVHASASIQVCIERNERRKAMLEARLKGHYAAQVFGEDPDVHYVPPSVMSNFYAKDEEEDQRRSRDQKMVLSLMPARSYFCLDNSADDKDAFTATVRQMAEDELLPLLERGESYEAYYYRRREQLRGTMESIALETSATQETEQLALR
ncbi:MAG TPA: hypothetical protein VFT48_09375 [Pyrinomonadaceae bacterium]|nr:hypothetical protein [Pyrinomonadaceae bacterium]